MKWTRTGCFLVALSGVAVLLPLHPAQAQTSRFVGRWQLDMTQSKTTPGETPPASLVTEIDRVDTAHVHWSTTTTNAQGEKDVETFDTPGNGEFYSLNGYTMVAHTLSPTSLQSTYKDISGQTDLLTCTLSANASQMTCNGVVTHQDGSVARYTDVFDRV